MSREGRDFESLRQRELRDAVVGVLLKKFVEDFAGLGTVLIEEGLFLASELCDSLPPARGRRTEREVTEKVERIASGSFAAAARESISTPRSASEGNQIIPVWQRSAMRSSVHRRTDKESESSRWRSRVSWTTRSCFPASSSS